MLVAQAVQLFLDARVGLVSSKTAKLNRDYLAALPEFFGERPIESISLMDLRTFRKHLVERDSKYAGLGNRTNTKLSPHTIHGYVRVTRQFFKWLCAEDVIPTNPAARLEQIPIQHAVTGSKMMTDEDFERMLAASGGDAPARIRNRALLWFFRQTGCRLGGVATVTLKDLELERGRATVMEKGKGGGKMRTVYLKAETLAALREWLDLRDCLPLSTENVFTTVPNDAGMGGGGALSLKAIQWAFQKTAERAKVKGKHNPHSLRHALAKRMLVNGANLAAVSKVMGHSDIRTTHEHYGRYEDGEAQAAHEKYA